MSNFLEEWGLPLEGDIQESFKPDPSIEANRQELEAVRGQEIFDKLPESMKVDPPTQEMLDAQRGQASFDQSPESEKIDSPTNMQHIVEQGDTLSQIAQGLGVDMNQLAELNQIQDPNKIQVGQILNLVGLGDQQQQPAVAPTPPVPEPTKEYSNRMLPTSMQMAKDHLIGSKSNIKTEEYLTKPEHEAMIRVGTYALKRALKGKLDKVIDSKFIKHKAGETAKGNRLYVVDGKDSDFIIIADDYDDIGKQAIGYGTPVTAENLADPIYNVKMGLSTVRLFTHNKKVYMGDEMNTPHQGYSHFGEHGEERLSKKDVLERITTIYNEWSEGKFKDKDDTKLGTAKGLFHRFAEAFGPEMGESFSSRILLGSQKELGLSSKQFKKIPTLEQYEKFMIKTGQLSEGHPSITWGRKKQRDK
ncbi:uncharacterized protein METZ01_LOCUS119940 [marine metagenome]|uniref:LysM domain-containing protein n=1 Tax=marine metagenome TaxID=408172 RepID=A0A381XQL7_9ZZZZ